MKRTTRVIRGHVRVATTYDFDDYPPGTPLPELPPVDLSGVHPLLRVMAARRVKSVQQRHQARIEAARADHYRRKESAGDSGQGSP